MYERCGVPRQAVPRGHDRYSAVVAGDPVVSPGTLVRLITIDPWNLVGINGITDFQCLTLENRTS